MSVELASLVEQTAKIGDDALEEEGPPFWSKTTRLPSLPTEKSDFRPSDCRETVGAPCTLEECSIVSEEPKDETIIHLKSTKVEKTQERE